MMLGRLRHDFRNIGDFRSRRLRTLRVCLFGLAHQFVGLFLRHLSAAYHVLHKVAGTFDGEACEAGGGADHILHGGGDFASRFLTDLLRAGRHFGNRVANIGAAVTGRAARSDRSGRRPGIDGGVCIGGQRLVGHGGSHSECANVEGRVGLLSICIRADGGGWCHHVISEGKYMILLWLCKE